MITFVTFLGDLEDTLEVGLELGAKLLAHPEIPWVIAVEGNLGAGKTSLAQGIARGLGVPPAIRVNSPTFSLHQTHMGQVSFHHIDLYRLSDEDELTYLGLDEVLETGVCFIEWPQRAPFLFSQTPHLKFCLYHLDEWDAQGGQVDQGFDGRILTIEGKTEWIEPLTQLSRWMDKSLMFEPKPNK